MLGGGNRKELARYVAIGQVACSHQDHQRRIGAMIVTGCARSPRSM